MTLGQALELVPIVTAIVTAGLAALAYVYYKRADLLAQHRSDKRELYREFLAALQRYKLRTIRTDHAGRREAVEDYLSAEAAILVFASHAVATQTQVLGQCFHQYIDAIRGKYEAKWPSVADFNGIESAFNQSYDELVRQMREDILKDASLIKDAAGPRIATGDEVSEEI